MITIPDLQTALLDLFHKLKDADIQLIIGGGFGIFLKAEHVRRTRERTLLHAWPEPRSTNDIDLFLRPELLIQPKKLKPLAEGLANLGYRPVPGAEKYQFVKYGPAGSEVGSIKIDILTGPQSRFAGTKVKTDKRRARPNPSIGLHAHPVDEVPTLEEGLLSKVIEGKLSSGASWKAEAFLPNPYTFLMMKLFAFKDRFNDPDKEFGRYHAMDLYTILATTMEKEWKFALELRNQKIDEPYIVEAGRLVKQYFSGMECQGIMRMRESRYYRPELQLSEFISTLQELFPVSESIHNGN